MNEQDFLNFVACDGLGYALLQSTDVDIKDSKMKKKVNRASKLLKEIRIWLDNNPDYEDM